jgi:hypothetical protein
MRQSQVSAKIVSRIQFPVFKLICGLVFKRYFAELPGTDDLGRRVYLIKGFEHDLKVHNNDDVNKVDIKINNIDLLQKKKFR